MLNASSLIAQAAQDAKAPNYTAQGLTKLQTILDALCFKHDLGLARGVYYFTLNPSQITTVNGVTNFSGPYPLPLDYLRTSGSSGSEGVQKSFFYYFNGVPYFLRPRDLGYGDTNVQQAGQQSLPYEYWTDVSPESTIGNRIEGTTTASTVLNSAVITPVSLTNMNPGQGVSGDGIAPGSTIITVGATTVTLSLPAVATFANTSGPGSAGIMFGLPVNAFIYPGSSGAFPATLRYQRMMPPVADQNRVPWFTDQEFLLEQLTARLMVTTDDTRREEMEAVSAKMLADYKVFSEDTTSRAQTVILDVNRFSSGGRRNRSWNRLRTTKNIGWP
jgi:hypothetical protein